MTKPSARLRLASCEVAFLEECGWKQKRLPGLGEVRWFHPVHKPDVELHQNDAVLEQKRRDGELGR